MNLGPEDLFSWPFRALVGELELLMLLMCGFRGGDFLLVLALAVLFFLCAVSLCFLLSSRVGMIEAAYSILGMATAFTVRLCLWFPLWKSVHKYFC